jgi:hypothetical protein
MADLSRSVLWRYLGEVLHLGNNGDLVKAVRTSVNLSRPRPDSKRRSAPCVSSCDCLFLPGGANWHDAAGNLSKGPLSFTQSS